MCCMLPKISEELIVGIFQGGLTIGSQKGPPFSWRQGPSLLLHVHDRHVENW